MRISYFPYWLERAPQGSPGSSGAFRPPNALGFPLLDELSLQEVSRDLGHALEYSVGPRRRELLYALGAR